MAQIFITNSSITLGISLQIKFLSWKNMSKQMWIFIGWDLDLLKLFFFFSISNLPKESEILCHCLLLANTSQLNIAGFSIKVTANLFGLEFCKILKSYHKIAHYIYFVLKKKLFENVFFLRSYCKFCVLRV